MSDDVLLAKRATIARCALRARSERAAAGDSFATDYTRQDAAILNIERACEAAIDIAFRLCRTKALGAPTNSREALEELERAGLAPAPLIAKLKRMVGFRNIATHAYENLDIAIVDAVIRDGLSDLEQFADLALRL